MTELSAEEFVRCALTASLFGDPLQPGLTDQELLDVGERFGRVRGELRDALHIPNVAEAGVRDAAGRYQPSKIAAAWVLYTGGLGHAPCPSPALLDFVRTEFSKQAKEVGRHDARLARGMLVARGEAQGYATDELHAGVTLLLYAGVLVAHGEDYAMPQAVIGPGFAAMDVDATPRPWVRLIQELLPPVRDIMARRKDGRLRSPEPLQAFEEVWTQMGYPQLKHWWTQNRTELARASDQQNPVSMILLSAALAEGALTAVVEHARSVGASMQGMPEEPRQWKLETLIRGARSGSDKILAEPLGQHCMQLNSTRQRIHPARFLKATAAEVDVRPEHAREAKQTADAVVRAVLDWLSRNPR